MGMARVFPEDYVPNAQFSGREHSGLITQPLSLNKHVEGRSDRMQTPHMNGENRDRVIEHRKSLVSYPLSMCINDSEES